MKSTTNGLVKAKKVTIVYLKLYTDDNLKWKHCQFFIYISVSMNKNSKALFQTKVYCTLYGQK